MSARIIFYSPSEILVQGDSHLKDWREGLEFPIPGHEYTPSFQAGTWDGLYRPGKWLRRSGSGWEFRGSRGLLHRIRDLYPDLLLPTELSRTHLDPLELSVILEHPTLRDYQRQALMQIFLHRWGRIALATNAGKGAIIGITASFFSKQKRRVLILCDEIAVFQALQEEIALWGKLSPSLVTSGSRKIPEELVTIAMVQTLSRRVSGKAGAVWREWLARMEVVLLDEADKATAKTWKKLLNFTTHSSHRIGFSGTFPGTAYGDLLMDELMGPVLVREKNMDLVERGISARPEVILHHFDSSFTLDDYFPGWKEWKQKSGPEKRLHVYDHAVVMNEIRHRFIQSLIQPGIPTCVVVNRVDHGRALAEAIPDAIFLSGSSSKTVREKVLQAFIAREFLVLVATKILDRGTNKLGHTVDLIFASGEGSTRQTLQRIGRGLRRSGGKEFLRLIDIVDSGHEYLHKAGKKRLALYRAEGFEVEVVRGHNGY